MVKDFTDTCHKHGLKVGVYYSPFDSATPLYQNDHAAYDDYFIAHMHELLGTKPSARSRRSQHRP